MLPVVLLLFSLITYSCAQMSTKYGDCPPYSDIGECDFTCFSDNHCWGSKKCCRTACGGTFCTAPVSKRVEDEQTEKPGACPSRPTGPWVCSSRCAVDSDCRGTKKCCKNRCGASACTIPVPVEEINDIFDDSLNDV